MDDKTATKPAQNPEVRNSGAEPEPITREKAARWLKGKAKVRVPRLDRDGQPLKIADGPGKGQFEVVERDPTEADIVKAEARGSSVVIVTVDGQKFETAR